jgi:hypothetical protein
MSYVSHTDYLKFPSGRSVGNSRKDAKKLQRTSGQALNDALNHVAMRNGFPNGWDKALSNLLSESLQRARTSSERLSVEAIASIAKRNPSLTQYGLGLLWAGRASYLGLTVEEYRQQEHDDLVIMLDECSRASRLLACLCHSVRSTRCRQGQVTN